LSGGGGGEELKALMKISNENEREGERTLEKYTIFKQTKQMRRCKRYFLG
jgi:hypothetical protein